MYFTYHISKFFFSNHLILKYSNFYFHIHVFFSLFCRFPFQAEITKGEKKIKRKRRKEKKKNAHIKKRKKRKKKHFKKKKNSIEKKKTHPKPK